MDFETCRADRIARRLATADDLVFDDFFEAGRIEIKTHPLWGERSRGPRCEEETDSTTRLTLHG